jgi:uncharacterized caspase-like protein
LPGERSHAQQDRNRQLVQTGSANDGHGKRVALVIGNGAYTNAPPLKNPPNDARDMAATLKALGFDVISGINVNQRDMKRMIREFGQSLKAGGPGLFYYAGHGVQSKGRNYLIPVDADIQSEAEVEDSGVDVSLVLNYMDDAQNGLNIVILDACRNNPFGRSFRSASEGLAQVDAPTGTLIAYATAPGRVASDGNGQNGLYTSNLLKQMRMPSLSVTEMFMHVRAEVMRQTGNKQVPWEASSLVGAFCFAGTCGANEAGVYSSAPPVSITDAAKEEALWRAVRDSNDPQDLKDYLAKYPNGAFVDAAGVKLRQMEIAKRAGNSAVEQSSVADNTSRARPTNAVRLDGFLVRVFYRDKGGIDRSALASRIADRVRSMGAQVEVKKNNYKDHGGNLFYHDDDRTSALNIMQAIQDMLIVVPTLTHDGKKNEFYIWVQ